MYLGIQDYRFNVYTDKTIASGWRHVKWHTYQCKHCGYIARGPIKAEEPFYCGGKTCQHLIGIEVSNDIGLEVAQQGIANASRSDGGPSAVLESASRVST